jgi:hypothetical protein
MSRSYSMKLRSILLAVTSAGTMLALAACSHGSTAPAAAPSGTPAASATPQAGATHHPKGVVGQITGENGDSWTVTNARGKQFTVTVTPQTAFGTKAAPATAQQFTVGAHIRALGSVTGSTVTATRITMARALSGAPGSQPSSAAPAPAGG